MADAPYHHGDLPSELVNTAIELLEENGAGKLSLRAVARHARVSTGAPYRHFPDRNALLSAVATVGYTDLARDLASVSALPSTAADLGAVAVAYVQFALRRPGLFRVMFAEGCDTTSPERVAAVAAIHDYLGSIVKDAMPETEPESMAIAIWSLVHGLAFLYLDGKLDASSDDAVAERVTSTVHAVLGVTRGGTTREQPDLSRQRTRTLI